MNLCKETLFTVPAPAAFPLDAVSVYIFYILRTDLFIYFSLARLSDL